MVNATVENLSLRMMRRQRFLIQVTCDTPREKLEELVSGIKQLIASHPMTNQANFNVRFNDFGKSSVNILVYFHVEITDYATELEASERYYCESSTLRNNRALILPSPRARW